jgi:hypothetical protein
MATPLDYEEIIDRHTAEAERLHAWAARCARAGKMKDALRHEESARVREREAAKHLVLMTQLVKAIEEEQRR